MPTIARRRELWGLFRYVDGGDVVVCHGDDDGGDGGGGDYDDDDHGLTFR